MDNSTYTVPQEAPQTTEGAQRAESPPPPPVKRRRPGRRKKIIKNIIAAAVTLAVAATLVWFTYSVFYSEPEVFYLTGLIEVWPEIKNEVVGGGYLRPAEFETVNITQQGNVLECYAFQNMMVNEGDVLAVIDSSAIDKAIEEYNKQVAALEREIDGLRSDIEKRYEQLRKDNAEQIAMAVAARMYAPFSGRVIGVPELTIGQQVYKTMPLGRLIDDSRMKLQLYFSYGYENDIYIGQNAEISIPSAMATAAGQVSDIVKIRRIGEDGSVSFLVEITMENPGTLRLDMAATASLRTADGEIVLPAEPDIEEPYKLKAFREVMLTAESEGPIKEFNLRNHYTFNEGDLLISLEFVPDRTIEDAHMAAIELLLSNVEAKEGQIREVLEDIDLELEKMEDLTVRAPISGTITFTNLEWGMKITETKIGTVQIDQLGTLVMDGWAGQNEIYAFSVGMEVDVVVWTQFGESYIKGIITEIDTKANQDGPWAQYPMLVAIDNSMGTVLGGSYANFSARLAYSENAIVVPIQAVKNIGSGEYVFLKPKDGKAPENAVDLGEDIVPPEFYAIPVKCGITNGRYIEITEGLLHEWEGWQVFTQTTDIRPSPDPSSYYEGENDDPNYREGYDDGYEAGLEAGKAEGGDMGWPDYGDGIWPDDGGVIWPDDGYFDEEGNWVPFPPDGGGEALPEDGYFDDEGNWVPFLPDDGGDTDSPGVDDGKAVIDGGGAAVLPKPVPGGGDGTVVIIR